MSFFNRLRFQSPLNYLRARRQQRLDDALWTEVNVSMGFLRSGGARVALPTSLPRFGWPGVRIKRGGFIVDVGRFQGEVGVTIRAKEGERPIVLESLVSMLYPDWKEGLLPFSTLRTADEALRLCWEHLP